MSRPVFVLALCGALLGCPANHRPPPLPEDAGVQDFVGRACNVDAECGALRCDKVRRQCICLSDLSCTSGDPLAPPRYCNNYTGLCVSEISGCTQDSQCGNTEFCDPSIRACRPLKTFCEPCLSNAECGGAGDNCVLDSTLNQKFCGRACNSTPDCPRGATCVQKDGVNQCWPDKTPLGQPATCNNFQACTPDSLRTCASTADCMDPSQRCDFASGKCVAISQICPFGTTCDPRAKLCVAVCVQDQDCGSDQYRCVNHICDPVSECQSDTDCAVNKVCSKLAGAAVGKCTPFCTMDTDCPLGQVCGQLGTRFGCTPGCTSNAGCPVDKRCNATTHQCEGPIVNGVKICQGTSACSSCQLCDGLKSECVNAKTTFPYCQTCSSPSECAGGTCVALPSGSTVCAKFCGNAGQECPQGFTCLTLTSGGQACVPADRSCTGKCP